MLMITEHCHLKTCRVVLRKWNFSWCKLNWVLLSNQTIQVCCVHHYSAMASTDITWQFPSHSISQVDNKVGNFTQIIICMFLRHYHHTYFRVCWMTPHLSKGHSVSCDDHTVLLVCTRATHKMDCQPGDYTWPLKNLPQEFVWVCMDY